MSFFVLLALAGVVLGIVAAFKHRPQPTRPDGAFPLAGALLLITLSHELCEPRGL